MRAVPRFCPRTPALRLDPGRKSARMCGPKIAVELRRMDFLPETEESDHELPTSPGARGFGGARLVRRRHKAAPDVAALASSVVAALIRYAAAARARLPRRISGPHAASFVGGILFGVMAMQFVGTGESAELPATAGVQSIPSPAPVPPPAALPSPAGAVPPASRETAAESVTASNVSPAAETRRAARAANYQGGLRIDSRPAGAAVFVNNQEVGHTPIVLSSLRAGSRAVRIQLGGYVPWSRSVRVVANQQAAVLAQLEPTR
jgi:hypothetical protein